LSDTLNHASSTHGGGNNNINALIQIHAAKASNHNCW